MCWACAQGTATPEILDQEQIQAAKREDVLNSLSQIARKLRTRLGESRATVEKHSMPLASATTPSLEALKAYSTALKAGLSSGSAQMPFFRRALEIDPNSPWRTPIWGCSTAATGESVLSARERHKSLATARSSQRQREVFHRLQLRSAGDGKSGKGVPNARVVASDLSSSWENPNAQGLLVGLSTHGTGRYERAIEAAQQRIAAEPDFSLGTAALRKAYFFLDRFPEAESTLQRASERKLENPTCCWSDTTSRC